MRKVIIASHGQLSSGLKDALKLIVGELANDIETYSLELGAYAQDFANEYREKIENEKDTEFIFFTDLFGASVCSAMSSLSMYENVRVFAGMNLNLILELLLSYPERLTDEDIKQLVENAKNGIMEVVLTEEEDEDF